jgi:hypothetical protein
VSRKIVLITLLSLCVTNNTIAAQNIVDLALQGIGAGSMAEMKNHIFSLPFRKYNAEDCRRAIATLPQSRRESRITGGRVLRKVQHITNPIIELHNRSNEVELFLYHDHFPVASVWMGCVLVISDALVDILSDDELAGTVAHEIAHAYFMVETNKAKERDNQQAMRIVELKCDAVAMLTLKLFGHDPADHLRGLRKVTNLTKLYSYSNPKNFSEHPTIKDRAEFAQRFIKLLV